jgi:hypothetical protein
MSPITTRIFLAVALLLAMGSAFFALAGIRANQTEAWATLAGALAVITSMISAWGAQRVVELEEDKLSPYPYPQFDVTSRYGLMLLKITNFGGGAAHKIQLVWDRPLKNSAGDEIRFAPDVPTNEVSVLVPGQQISKLIDGSTQFFTIPGPHVYRGIIKYEDSRGRKKSLPFLMDAESLKGTPSYVDERVRTQFELQKLPDVLKRLCDEVQRAATILDKPDNRD